MSTPRTEEPESKSTTDQGTSSERSASVVDMNPATRSDETGWNPRPNRGTPGTASSSSNSKKARRGWNLLLLVLLLVSVAFNVLQAQQRRESAARSLETQIALDRAIVRIDAETIRANQAEGTLTEIDRNVDTVQERIAELQSALSKLAESVER